MHVCLRTRAIHSAVAVGSDTKRPVVMAVPTRKLRILSLHSFRTSAAIFQEQFARSGLDRQLEDLVELVYLDAPIPASGPAQPDVTPFFKVDHPPEGLLLNLSHASANEARHSPNDWTVTDNRKCPLQGPYFEWWNAQKIDGRTVYEGWEHSVSFVEHALKAKGPFDGLMGFSQGGMVASVLMGLQQQGLALIDVPPLDFVIIFGAGRSQGSEHQVAFSEKIKCPALLLWGTRDPMMRWCETLPECFETPLVIEHGRGHVIPQLDKPQLDVLRSFLQTQQQNSAL